MKVKFLFLFLSFLCCANTFLLHAQQDTLKNQFGISGGYPLPASMNTFKLDFTGMFSSSLHYERSVSKHFIAGGNISYSLFGTTTHINSKMNVITASGNAGYKLRFLKKTECVLAVKAGYSEILFRTKDIQPPDNKFNEGGFSAEPIVILNYLLSKKLAIGIHTSYTIIFKHFGDSDVAEDATIRFLNFGLGFNYMF